MGDIQKQGKARQEVYSSKLELTYLSEDRESVIKRIIELDMQSQRVLSFRSDKISQNQREKRQLSKYLPEKGMEIGESNITDLELNFGAKDYTHGLNID